MQNKRITQNWIGFYTLSYKESYRVLRIWRQTLVPPIITTTLYFLIFGGLIGNRIGEMNGFSYMQFIAPGLTMMAAITAAYINTASSFFLSKFVNNIEEILVSPLSTHTIIWGYLSGSLVRSILVAILVTAISMCFVDYNIYSWWVIILTLLMTTIAFGLGGLINAIFARTFDDIGVIPTFVLTPLTYLGGVFYSISLLPDFWQSVSKFNPIVYMINGFRFGFLGQSDVGVFYTFSVLTFFVLSLYVIAYYLIEKGIGLRS
ncbi:ABC-2 type transport system permease protein [Nicoletella semolina]|uniref:Transport permease protein n=1 Tax=Nicoletella semolina TaxID=271160 RepID=A0A4R2NAU8_9PAST|nr:ABC transporter permease [Nicoletella semolina]MDH2924011.1 ABC transporter permease [Nicoletella semolina]TCP18144.1 ABC-2 type transport system permease protein [Nicoletella semolina]